LEGGRNFGSAKDRFMMHRRDFLAGVSVALTADNAFADVPELQSAARDAWLFALPLIEVAALRAHPDPASGKPSPVNSFRHARSLSGPMNRAVTTPNNDTLYSTAFVDTTTGPVGLEIPDCGKRYLSVQIMDMYTDNTFVLSPRTPGGAAGAWRLISPHTEPRDARDLRLATPHAWLQARTLVNGPSDLPAVHAIQDRLKLDGAVAPPPFSKATARADWPAYFAAAQELVNDDPPPFKNGLEAFVTVRDSGGAHDFSRAGYTPDTAAAIDAGVAQAVALLRSVRTRKQFTDGWTYPRADLGEYGDNIVFRATVAVAGLGALTPAEAMYLRPAGDGQGLFNGDGLYRLSLPRPIPVDAFWSLTMYEAAEDGRWFLTENSLNRYSVGDRTEGLSYGPNGALDVWIGRSDPGGARTANWLPAPRRGPFALTLRAYLPGPALLNGTYRLPPIVPV
jgi:hypothetical protein